MILPVFLTLALAAQPVPGAAAGEADCSPSQAPRYEAQRALMGTLFRVVVRSDQDPSQIRAAMEQALDLGRELEQTFSDYQPSSEVNSLAQSGGGTPSPDVLHLLERSTQLHHETGGAFDVAQGHLTRLWRRAERRQQAPDEEALSRAAAQSGMHLVHLQTGDELLLKNGVRLDFGGIAKGYAADRLLELLERAGLSEALIDAGGDLRIGAGGWAVSVDGVARVECHSAIASSGGRWQQVSGMYAHIVDPATGKGVAPNRSVTVRARDATTADALATAFSVMPPSEARSLAAHLNVELTITRHDP
ncbi:MAG: FAD:protein FMN transferase [Rhodothermales bacterium]|nr:FAD:protein FMN transferase [Rhodothermales bacterium]MBO6780129.1 FAD:protein FMN transferase [Rhodothermales bacterium]